MVLSWTSRTVLVFTLTYTLARAPRLPSQVEWKREGSGPVLPPATGGGKWVQVGDPTVLSESGGLTLWYDADTTSTSGVARATSSDGVEWLEDEDFVLPRLPGTWEHFIYTPRVIVESSEYRMWYSGNNQGRCGIGHATSPDGISWTRYAANPILFPSQPWERTCTDSPSVIFDAGTYRMWYAAGNFDDLSAVSIGYATSTDGLGWTKHAGNPVLQEGSSDVHRGAALPCVLLDARTSSLEMWYTIFETPQDSTASIGYATSMDGTAWARHPGNPVFQAGDWDLEVGAPAVLFDGRQYRMWYTGGSSGAFNIGQATAPWSIPRASFSATHAVAFDGEQVGFDASLSVSPNGEVTSYRWDFDDGESAEGLRASHAYAKPGHHVVTLTVLDAAGKEGAVARAVEVRLRPGDLGSWTCEDIGEHALPSGARFEGNGKDRCLGLHTRGGDLGLRADFFHFVEREIDGDFTLNVQIASLAASSPDARVGIMVREDLGADARHASIVAQGVPESPLKVLYRTAAGGLTRMRNGPASQPPPSLWLRLERRGSVVTAFASDTGETWTQAGEPVSFDPPLGAAVHAGVAASAGSGGSEGGFQDLFGSVCNLQITQGIGPFLRGDCNGDGVVKGQVTDAVFLLAYSFTGGDAPPCAAACDDNADDNTDISDAVYLLSFNFLGGPAPASPFPGCGTSNDASDAALGCEVPLEACP